MSRIVLLSTAFLISAAPIGAQNVIPIKRLEIGFDVGTLRSQGHDLLKSTNSTFSVRYGAVNSQYRFTIDQRVTLGDRRLLDSPGATAIDTQLGWRLGSRARLNTSVLGPYVFGAFNLTSKSAHFRDAKAPSGPLFGYSAGMGARLMIFHTSIRPELFWSFDPGIGRDGDTFWIPNRSAFGVRLGYGFHFPVANQ
jgi:hypothetical protein